MQDLIFHGGNLPPPQFNSLCVFSFTLNHHDLEIRTSSLLNVTTSPPPSPLLFLRPPLFPLRVCPSKHGSLDDVLIGTPFWGLFLPLLPRSDMISYPTPLCSKDWFFCCLLTSHKGNWAHIHPYLFSFSLRISFVRLISNRCCWSASAFLREKLLIAPQSSGPCYQDPSPAYTIQVSMFCRKSLFFTFKYLGASVNCTSPGTPPVKLASAPTFRSLFLVTFHPPPGSAAFGTTSDVL